MPAAYRRSRPLAAISQNVGLTKTVNIELLQNEELRDAVGILWQQRIWEPMVQTLTDLQANGKIRKEVDVEVLARAIHCLHVGYFLARHVFAPQAKWNDAREIDQMAEILLRGSSAEPRHASPGARPPSWGQTAANPACLASRRK